MEPSTHDVMYWLRAHGLRELDGTQTFHIEKVSPFATEDPESPNRWFRWSINHMRIPRGQDLFEKSENQDLRVAYHCTSLDGALEILKRGRLRQDPVRPRVTLESTARVVLVGLTALSTGQPLLSPEPRNLQRCCGRGLLMWFGL